MVVMDPMVQKQILTQARAGTPPPRVLMELIHYMIGLPPAEPEPLPPDRRREEIRAQMALLNKGEIRQLAEMSRKVPERLHGMFVFARFEAAPQPWVLLVCDRFGIKPLYISGDHSGVVFASEVSAVMKSGLVPSERTPKLRAGSSSWATYRLL